MGKLPVYVSRCNISDMQLRESEFLCLFPSVFTIEFQCFSVFPLSVIYYLISVTDSFFCYSCFCFSSFLVKRLALHAALSFRFRV